MQVQELTLEETQALLATPEPQYAPSPIQEGPLRFFDNEMLCTSRRCGSPTWIKVKGMPLCIAHALRELNQMLIERGVLS